MKFSKEDKIIIDLDGTITINDPRKGYHEKPLNEEIAETVKGIANEVSITVFTARNMKTYAGDVSKIELHTRPVATKWLEENGIPHAELIMGKPWCGPNGFYVDDKNLHMEEFIFRFSPHIKDKTFDVVVSFYNEGEGALRCYQECKRIERLLEIKNFIFVNNGSKDKTLEFLQSLAEIDSKVKVIDNPGSRGYGNGYQAAMKNSTADYIITNHADGQFDLYEFVYAWRHELKNLSAQFDVVLPKRVGRPFYDSLISSFLRGLMTIIFGQVIKDFNGQPKIFPRLFIQSKLESAPSDFTFDLWLYVHLMKTRMNFLPIIQKNRLQGDSTWNRGLSSQLKLALTFLKQAFIIKRNL